MVKSTLEEEFEMEAPFLLGVLEHFRSRLFGLRENDESGFLVNPDIDRIIEDILAAKEATKVPHTSVDDFIAGHKSLMYRALTLYVSDLESSKKHFHEELGLEFEMPHIDEELEHANSLLDEHWGDRSHYST